MKRKRAALFAAGCIITLAAVVMLYQGFLSNPQPQTKINSFTPSDYFPIPEYNGSIHFAREGSYGSASFEKPTAGVVFSAPIDRYWRFTSLQLDGSPLPAGTSIFQFKTATLQ